MKNKLVTETHNEQQINDAFYSKPSDLFASMSEQQKNDVLNKEKCAGGASIETQKEHIKSCLKADSGYGAFIAYALGIPLTDFYA